MPILKKPGKIFRTIDWSKPLSYEVRLAEDFADSGDVWDEYLWHEDTTRNVESVTLYYSDGTEISLAHTGTREMPGPGGKYGNPVKIKAYNPAAIVQLAHWILERGKPQYIDAGWRNQHQASIGMERESDTPGMDSWYKARGGKTEFRRMEQLLLEAARQYVKDNMGQQMKNPWQDVTSTFYDRVVPSKLEDVTMRLLIKDGFLRSESDLYNLPTDQFVAFEKRTPSCVLESGESVSIPDLHLKLIGIGERKLEDMQRGIKRLFNQGSRGIQASYTIGSNKAPVIHNVEYVAELVAKEIGDFPFKKREFEVELLPEKLF